MKRVHRKIVTSIASTFAVLAHYLLLSRQDRALGLRDGFADHRSGIKVDEPRERSTVERVIRAYQRAKADWTLAPDRYALRGVWAEWIDVNFGELVKAAASRDISRLGELLRNFAREPFAFRVGGSYDDVLHYRTPVLGSAYVRTVWCQYRDFLLDAGFDLKTIAYPLVGNPAGVFVNGSVIQIDTLRHAYSGFAIMHLMRDVKRPVIVEVGGGFGGQAFQTILQLQMHGNAVRRYIDFDIPEVQIVVGYFLLNAFPELDVRLYGEGEIEVDRGEEFDIGVFPHFAIDRLEDSSVDLVFNANSFSEMDQEAAMHYLAVTNRVCRKYFFHVNHERRLRFSYRDGTTSSNLLGSELLPDHSRFKRIYKRPRLFMRPEDKLFKSFAYLYERTDGLV